MAVLLAEIVVNTGYVLVIELGEDVRFAVKSHGCLALDVRIGEVVEHLRQRTRQLRWADILHIVVLLHSSAAQKFHDPVPAAYDGVNGNHDVIGLNLAKPTIVANQDWDPATCSSGDSARRSTGVRRS